MNIRRLIILTAVTISGLVPVKAAEIHLGDPKYVALRDSMRNAFNAADSAKFYPALQRLENYLLEKDDLHGYYTQRCNEIVFLINRQHIYEAYVLGRKLSAELREKGLEKEMYMAYNMLGHINNYCGNKTAAKRNFYKVLELMEKYGFYESMPPIYMNIVNVELGDDPEETHRLLEKALETARKYSPDRVFDIETRKGVTYFNDGDIPHFLEVYKKYKEGEKEGKSSVHGRTMEVYYLATLGKTDEAVELARKELAEDGDEVVTMIYEKAGRWKEAYESLRKDNSTNDSINNVVLINSMEGIREQLTLFDMERTTTRNRIIGMGIGLLLLMLLVTALTYIVYSRRRHLRQLEKAYNHALESDRMKTAFIQNVSHEIRTPLNIISGFAQIIADPEMARTTEERQHMAKMMETNTRQITTLIDEVLELSLSESSEGAVKEDTVRLNSMLRDILQEYESITGPDVDMIFDSTINNEFTITTNKMLLKRAVTTLIDNAVKNTSKGHVSVKTSVIGTQLSLAVEDTGRGIPQEEAEHIFERFVKLDSFKEGLGLGLPLCRTLVRRLGGDVHLDTTFKGPGARFVITLPIENNNE